ncbi:hypothetical protein Xmir_02047 [Xenorhabdus miraniensis]|uniref:Uncharacterized protein n=1 Tax=Xenorhabdus miraniensis TaxID=351674 RepID=A0A2D0JQN2_9GAMM|nr:hypothetical protein Xmir_02047 [Xenorhabdus miraniensis]
MKRIIMLLILVVTLLVLARPNFISSIICGKNEGDIFRSSCVDLFNK